MMRVLIFVTLLAVSLTTAIESTAQEAVKKPELSSAELGTTKNVHSFGLNLLCGQPSREDLSEAAKRGVKTVISLREEGEVDWDEAGAVGDLGLEFHRFGFLSSESLTDGIFDESLKLLAESDKQPVMLHCGSANRVGAIWLAHRVLNDQLDVEMARKEAKIVGLRTAGYEEKALAYIEKHKSGKSEASVKPGINDRFLDPALDVSEWLGRFEIESREIYAAREKVLQACEIKAGFKVADIGAGTGFYSRIFASTVGEDGWVYAVDISPRFLEHINRKSLEDDLNNVTSVLCSDRSVGLPPNSIDFAFVCDTYHHFEYPQSTLASIHRAMKPGGTLIVVDFERIPGKSREFIIGHVRAGKEVFKNEIVESGFRYVDEVNIAEFKENYLIRFRKE